jgi:hypothetical protein
LPRMASNLSPPILASQVAGITGVSHHAWPALPSLQHTPAPSRLDPCLPSSQEALA